MRKKIRVGIIGAGRVAEQVHLPSLKGWPSACVVLGVAARSEERARGFARAWDIPRVYRDWSSLLADPEIDAVVICVPSGITSSVAVSAIRAGKHILCEKPLGLTYSEARTLQLAAGQSDRVHMMGFTYRFVPALRYLKRLICEGEFGQIRHWRLSYTIDLMCDPNTPATWRNYEKMAGAGVLTDMGSHAIDTARFLLGEIRAVCGTSTIYTRERPNEFGTTVPIDAYDACTFSLEFSNDALGSIDLNRAVSGGIDGLNQQNLALHGTKGSAFYESSRPSDIQVGLGSTHQGGAMRLVEVPIEMQIYPGSPRTFRHGNPSASYKFDQISAFIQAIRGDISEYPSFDDGAEAQRVVDAVSLSIKQRSWVNIAELKSSR